MIYHAFQTQTDLMQPARVLAGWMRTGLANPALAFGETLTAQALRAVCEMVERAGLTHARPSFDIASVRVGNRDVAVREETALVTPFATLLRFAKDIDTPQPRVLVVAPLSGHFATLLRGTVETLLADHDVYITDWHNARDVPRADGRFGFDEYVEHLMTFLRAIGPGTHLVAVCQPCVQALVAAAVMAEDADPAQPASMTLMAGPIDTRVNPTEVNRLATGKPIEWFESNLIARVPAGFPGAFRRVYPGFVQVGAFMSMNLDRHVKGHMQLLAALATGNSEKAHATKSFYDEYFAVLDLPAEFYLETVQWVFQEFRLATGELEWRGRRVDPSAIRRTALLTVEGERDDICSVGQTLAAHDLCTSLRPYRKRHHLQAGVGHYGVFSGRRWNGQVYPIVRNFILAND